jgi:hypothetical protein
MKSMEDDILEAEDVNALLKKMLNISDLSLIKHLNQLKK